MPSAHFLRCTVTFNMVAAQNSSPFRVRFLCSAERRLKRASGGLQAQRGRARPARPGKGSEWGGSRRRISEGKEETDAREESSVLSAGGAPVATGISGVGNGSADTARGGCIMG